jgi:protease I
MATLENRRVAILTEEGFEQVELTSPKAALKEAGAIVDVISPKSGKIKAWDKTNWLKLVRMIMTHWCCPAA